MHPGIMRRALCTVGLTASTRLLLAYMADVANDDGMFFQSRARTSHTLGLHPDTIKTALRELIHRGYVLEEQPARAGKNTRRLRLLPDTWPQPEPWSSAQSTTIPQTITRPEPAAVSPVEQLRAELRAARYQ